MYGTKFHSSCESFSFFHTFGPGGTVSFCTVSLSSSVVKSHFFEILLPLVVVANEAHAPRLASYDGVVPCWGDDGDLSLYTARPCDMKTCVHVPTTRVVPKFSCFPPCPLDPPDRRALTTLRLSRPRTASRPSQSSTRHRPARRLPLRNPPTLQVVAGVRGAHRRPVARRIWVSCARAHQRPS